MKRLLWIILFIHIGYAQVDEVFYNPSTQQLSYVIDYNRLAENAIARECSPDVFESGLLHSVLRHLILYMPYEAGFYAGVTTIDVRVLQGENRDEVLYASLPLNEAQSITTKFRVFMNSFASPRAGYCFTVDPSVLESWISTLLARQGVLAYDNAILQIPIAQAKPIAEVLVPVLPNTSAVAATTPESTPTSPSEPTSTLATPEPPEATTLTVEQPEGFSVAPYLSQERVLNFNQGQWVLKPDTDYAAMIETSQGTMTMDLFEVQTPNTVNNFVFLALNQYYDQVPFFRVIEDFMAQTGDPTGTGLGTPGYQFADELSAGFSHSTKGVVSMANAGPNTNGAQFFITLEATPWLDGQFSIFGAVIDGVDVLDRLQRANPDAPLALASLDSSLGLLETQGVTLEGNDRETLEAYLTRTLSKTPEANQRFRLDNNDLVLMVDPQSGETVAVFYPPADTIEHVYILERPQ
jgi:cyclophilin family peptidyl-prolyl cis-trans isomerase